ncbi:MAG: hypothetical protein FWF76_04815 [Oscillospiraceae bacterium]|nr:hypothetical protein [Oscillospiraceae bacterium]
MNVFFLFLLIFFGILGVFYTLNIIYTTMICKISDVIFRKNNNTDGTKFWCGSLLK